MFKKFTITCFLLFLLSSCTPEENITIDLPADEKTELIIIEIKGAIKKPGLYTVSNGIMLYEVINIAGGLLYNASTTNLNLTQVFNNNTSIIIPFNTDHLNSQLININIASIEELMTLSGIGEAKAMAIIEYRQKNYFNTIEDIMKVSGISESLFNKIKDDITV